VNFSNPHLREWHVRPSEGGVRHPNMAFPRGGFDFFTNSDGAQVSSRGRQPTEHGAEDPEPQRGVGSALPQLTGAPLGLGHAGGALPPGAAPPATDPRPLRGGEKRARARHVNEQPDLGPARESTAEFPEEPGIRGGRTRAPAGCWWLFPRALPGTCNDLRPDVPFVVLKLVAPQELNELLLKRDASVMLLLVCDVLLDLR